MNAAPRDPDGVGTLGLVSRKRLGESNIQVQTVQRECGGFGSQHTLRQDHIAGKLMFELRLNCCTLPCLKSRFCD